MTDGRASLLDQAWADLDAERAEDALLRRALLDAHRMIDQGMWEEAMETVWIAAHLDGDQA